MRIANNIMAMNTHRFYTNNNSAVSKSAEKLSSGYRINRAGDDAAGLAISEKMRAQIRGLNMAKKNSQDAVSLVQTAEGALQEVHSMLQRMNELAVQSASGTNDTTVDRAALQQEFKNLQDEIDQVASTTTFNDMKILDGSLGSGAATSVLEGTTDLDNLTGGAATTELKAAVTTGLDKDAIAKAAAAIEGATAGDLEITFEANGADKIDMKVGDTVIGTATIDVPTNGGGAKDLEFKSADGVSLGKIQVEANAGQTPSAANVQAQVAGITGGKVTLTDPNAGGDAAAAATFSFDLAGISATGTAAGDTFKVTLGAGIELVSKAAQTTDTTDAKIAALFDGQTVQIDGVDYTASVDGTKITLTAGDEVAAKPAGVNDKITFDKASGTATAGGALTADALTFTEAAGEEAAAGNGLVIQVGAEEGQTLTIQINAMNTTGLKLTKDAVDISTQTTASKAITSTRTAINAISTQRAELGAMQNRLEYKINNLANTAENLSSAESRIRDVDIASEMTTFTKNNILSQAATAMLAQANALPQNVLSLLQ